MFGMPTVEVSQKVCEGGWFLWPDCKYAYTFLCHLLTSFFRANVNILASRLESGDPLHLFDLSVECSPVHK
jgi:hypothetical protein